MRENHAIPVSPYHYPLILQDALSHMEAYPLTVVEAASGFGKTTAVREYLAALGHHAFWHTCYGEPPVKTWNRICRSLSHIDGEAARVLERIGAPCEENLADIADCMRTLRCDQESWLVIDNFQYIQETAPSLLIEALSVNSAAPLHIVLITQMTGYRKTQPMQNDRVYCLENDTFYFKPEDIDALFKKSGITLTPAELQELFRATEGWISALNLQKIHYQQTGRLGQSSAIDSLLQSAVWNRLDAQERRFLIAVSVLDNFTAEQARIVLDATNLPVWATRLLESNIFIRYDTPGGVYVLHNLLRGFLEQELSKLPDTEKSRLWRLAGDAYARRGMHYLALRCYLGLREYDALLSLPIRGNEFTDYLGAGSAELLEQIVTDCPPDIMMRHPRTLLVIAFELFMIGSYEPFGTLCGMIGELLSKPEQYGMGEQECREIAGQFIHLQSFAEFNDIAKMSAKHREAWELLGGPATLFDWNDAWTFGQPSVLYLFWGGVGELEHELALMDECMPYYNRLTNAHGTGAESAMRAEALLMRGDDTGAEALCHKALYLASAKEQDSICYAAEFTLLRIAVLRGDVAAYAATLENMRARVRSGNESGGKKEVELAVSFLHVMRDEEDVEEWITDPDAIKASIYDVAVPFGLLIYLKTLLLRGEDAKLLGLIGALFPMLEEHRFLLPQVYLLLFATIAQRRQGREEDARETMRRALDMSAPDRIYLPFAEHGAYIMPLLERCKDREGVREILALYERQAAGAGKLRQAQSEMVLLTQREREVAVLANEGLSNKVIAERLFISLGTVKTLLGRIFQKLEIESRAQLKEREF